MNYRTVLSIVGSVALGQGVPYAWYILLVANLIWIAYHWKLGNKESLQLHGFYALNAIMAILH